MTLARLSRQVLQQRLQCRQYDILAQEYYDARRHPTCANFGEASSRALRGVLSAVPQKGRVLEIGCGRSTVAELLVASGGSLRPLMLTDASPQMLLHSSQYESLGAQCFVADASDLPINAGSVELIVSSLGDPYNCFPFWHEVQRLLKPHGGGFFTTPSYDWCRAFRTTRGRDTAEFELADRSRLETPSFICSKGEQARMIEAAGLRLLEIVDVAAGAISRTPISSKLISGNALASVVTLYRFEKPSETDV